MLPGRSPLQAPGALHIQDGEKLDNPYHFPSMAMAAPIDIQGVSLSHTANVLGFSAYAGRQAYDPSPVDVVSGVLEA